MIRKRGLPPVIWWLFGLLVVAAFGVTLGNHESETNPSTSNFDASGQAALFNLLKRTGYDVEEDMRTHPKLGPHDVAICFRPTLQSTSADALLNGDSSDTFYTNLANSVQSGARAVVFQYSPQFEQVSKQVEQEQPVAVQNAIVPRTLHIMSERPSGDAGNALEEDFRSWLAVWKIGNEPLVSIGQLGTGKVVVCESSMPASNRFLDKADDAEFVHSVIGLVAKPGDRIVFTEASFGNVSDPGFFEMLGEWALAGWRQAILLFLVLIFTLGKRFGYPEERRTVVRSSRDLADAFGNLLHRARRIDLCTQMALARIDGRVRKLFRIPKDASVEERNRVLPESILSAVAKLEAASAGGGARPAETLRLVQAANREIDDYAFATPAS